MPTDNFGSARIWRHGNLSFSKSTPQSGSNTFPLGLNWPYGATGDFREPKPYELLVAANERLDNWDHGCMWQPASIPGMSLCIGAARSGKGAGIIIPSLTFYGGNTLTNDPKGENFWVCGKHRRTPANEGGIGHKVALCDPFGEVNRAYGSRVGVTETVTKYNPLADLDPDSPDFPEDVAAIGDAISIDLGGGENSNFFSGSGRDMIDGIIAACVITSARGRGTLRMLRQWLTMENAAFGEVVQNFCKDFPDSLAASKLRQYADMTDRTNIGVKATAKQQTVFLDSEQLLKYMEPGPHESTFDFSELATGALDVFLVLPGTHTVNYKRWSRMMVNKSIRAVLRARNAHPTLPVTYLLDEAGTSLGHLEVVETAYGLTSGLGILIWSFYQDLSQMQRDYPKSWQTFIANSATIQLLGVGDNATAKYWSDYIGQSTVTTEGSTSGQTTGGDGRSSSSSSKTTGEAGRPVFTPDEIMHIPDREMIVIYSRKGAYTQFKLRYFEDGRFNGLYRPDPTRLPAGQKITLEDFSFPPAYKLPPDPTYGAARPEKIKRLRKWSIGLWCAVAVLLLFHFEVKTAPGIVSFLVFMGALAVESMKSNLPKARWIIEMDPAENGKGFAVPRPK